MYFSLSYMYEVCGSKLLSESSLLLFVTNKHKLIKITEFVMQLMQTYILGYVSNIF